MVQVILFTLALSSPAYADCPATPIGHTNDMVVSFMAAHGTQAAPASELPATAKEGMLVYDSSTDSLKLCDGTTWHPISMGTASDPRIGTLDAGKWCSSDGNLINCTTDAPATVVGSDKQVIFNDGGTTLGGATQLIWDKTNNRLGIGTTSPGAALEIRDTVSHAVMRLWAFQDGTPASNAVVQLASKSAGSIPDNNWYIGSDGTQTYSPPLKIGFTHGSWSMPGDGDLITIRTTGHVGIGVTNPRSRLHVAGGMQMGDDTDTCPGASNIKLGTVRYSGGAFSVCVAAGWTPLMTGTGAVAAGDAGQVQFNGGAGAFAADASLHWDNTNKRLGIGIAAPQRTLHLARDHNMDTGLFITNMDPGAAARANLTFRADSHGFDIFAASSVFGGLYGDLPIAGAAIIRSYSSVGARPTAMFVGTGAANPLHLMTASRARMTVDGDGRVLIGVYAPYQTDGSITPRFQVHGPSATLGSISATAWTTNAGSPGSLVLGRSRSATMGTNAIVQQGDILGGIFFNGDDGTGFKRAAHIEARSDAAPGANDMPGNLVFATTPDGTAIPVERMRIRHDGNIGIGTSAPILNTDGRVVHVHHAGTGASAIRFTNTTTGAAATDGMLVGRWNDGYAAQNIIYSYENESIHIGAGGNDSILEVRPSGDVMGAAKDVSGAKQKICSGTAPSSGWQPHTVYSRYMNISTAGCGFTAVPRYFTTISGTNAHWVVTGATSIYSKTATGFRLYLAYAPWVGNAVPDSSFADWSVDWMAIGH